MNNDLDALIERVLELRAELDACAEWEKDEVILLRGRIDEIYSKLITNL